LTAQDLLKLGLIDRIIQEPIGGAHRNRTATINAVGETIAEMLGELEGLDKATLLAQRKAKYLNMGKKSLS
jgi:acetyl-CoA carboxylase carboxyl transferase subunit alpha